MIDTLTISTLLANIHDVFFSLFIQVFYYVPQLSLDVFFT